MIHDVLWLQGTVAYEILRKLEKESRRLDAVLVLLWRPYQVFLPHTSKKRTSRIGGHWSEAEGARSMKAALAGPVELTEIDKFGRWDCCK